MTDRVQVELEGPGLPRAGTVIRYGHWGRPVIVFPSSENWPVNRWEKGSPSRQSFQTPSLRLIA